MELILGGFILVIVVAALCNPRLWRDIKNNRSSIGDVLDEGKEDLKQALSRKSKKPKK